MLVNLTPEFIETELICPDGKSKVEYRDTELKGFMIVVTRTGTCTYVLRYKYSGKYEYKTIGSTSYVSLDKAREQAIQIREDIAMGKDPKANLKKCKQVPFFKVFFKKQYIIHAKQHKRTWKNDEQMFDKHLKAEFGSTKLNAIKRVDVERFHLKLREDGLSPTTADHYIKLMRHMLNLAVDWDLIDNNPIAGIKLFRENNCVENYMDEDQLAGLLKVLRTHPNRPTCNIALFLLSTGARRKESLQAEWKYIDLVNRVWRVPSSVSKSKKMRSIPLNDSAIDVLMSLDSQGEYEHVFINKRTGLPFR